MEFNDNEGSSNVEDRRGLGPVGIGGGIGLGGIAIVVIGALLGVDPSTMLNIVQTAEQGSSSSTQRVEQKAKQGDPGDEIGHFASQVLRSTEQVWSGVFQQSGKNYRNPKLVLYSQLTPTACGGGQSAMGPFYCPNDEKVYLDLSFFNELDRRFHAPGRFPEAYVIAHEVGHHVQKLSGTFDRMERSGAAGSRGESSASVRLELQADCYAGVWAKHAGQENVRITDADIQQALTAASAIGDDKLQQQSQGRVVPDSFTHGSSAQRMRWFKRGMESGRAGDCDTFSAQTL
jgi:predicted metalloprotease